MHLSIDKGIDYVIICKSKGLYSFILSPQHTAFLHSINFFDIYGRKYDNIWISLKKAKVKLDLLTDIDILLMVEKVSEEVT